MADSWLARPESFEDLFAFLPAAGVLRLPGNGEDTGGHLPQVLDSLARWALLYDVPFQYLVVNEEALPPESLRFFFVDFSSLFALLDGALSIGRTFEMDYRHDKAMIESVIRTALQQRLEVRPLLQGKPEQEAYGRVLQNRNAAPEEQPETGFLLRSALVKGWRGLEFQAYGANGEELPALRLETLGEDVLLGLYGGELARLEIRQPPEGLQYGFTRKSGGGYEKRLRRLEDGRLYGDGQPPAEVAMRHEALRVVDMAQTAENIRQALKLASLDAAHIAVEMIQNPLTGVVEKK